MICSFVSRSVVAAAALALPAFAQAQAVRPISTTQSAPTLTWAQKMFSDLKFEFGNVAKNSDVRRQVVITNLYGDEITFRNVSTTCTCGQPSLQDPNDPSRTTSEFRLKTHETGVLNVKIDTVGHSGHRHPTISVECSFRDKSGVQRTETVRIPTTVDIRTDLTLSPGAADFGAVDLGVPAERRVSVVNTAYGSNWQITEVRSANEHVKAELKQTSRANGRIAYDVVVKLDGQAPAGDLRDQVTLVTNDARNPQIPLLVRASVVPEFQVIPAVIKLGDLKPGVDKTVTVVVKSKKPFAIEKCESDSKADYNVKLDKTAKVLHILPVKITPSGDAADLKMHFTLTIAGRQVPVTFDAEGKVQQTEGSSTAAK
jgi:hypothetical protein